MTQEAIRLIREASDNGTPLLPSEAMKLLLPEVELMRSSGDTWADVAGKLANMGVLVKKCRRGSGGQKANNGIPFSTLMLTGIYSKAKQLSESSSQPIASMPLAALRQSGSNARRIDALEAEVADIRRLLLEVIEEVRR